LSYRGGGVGGFLVRDSPSTNISVSTLRRQGLDVEVGNQSFSKEAEVARKSHTGVAHGFWSSELAVDRANGAPERLAKNIQTDN
jgi:hypothetical protein